MAHRMAQFSINRTHKHIQYHKNSIVSIRQSGTYVAPAASIDQNERMRYNKSTIDPLSELSPYGARVWDNQNRRRIFIT